MTHLTRSRALRAGLLATPLCALALGASSRADVVNAFYFNTSIYNYKILHMPDIDQRRSALPLDGNMYCVPTSTFNNFAYAANHGFAGFVPDDVNWESNNYVVASVSLFLIGDWMNTDPDRNDGGTGGSGTKAGMDELLSQTPFLKRVHKGRSSSYTPNVAKLAYYGASGWAMSLVYGRYEQVDTENGLPVLERDGGHAVTLTRAYRDPDQWILRYRDPADDSANLSTQSGFKNTTRSPWAITAYFGGTSIYDLRTMTAIFASSGVTRIIDVLYGIRPIYGISFTAGNDSAAGGVVTMLDPIPFEGSKSAQLPAITIPSNLEVLDFAFDSEFQNALVLAKSTQPLSVSRLRTLDLSSGVLSTLLPSPISIKKFATDRFDRIYAITGGTLHKLAADGTPLSSTTAIPTPADVAVNDGDDSVWVLSVAQRQAVKISLDFSETLLTLNVPTNVPMSGDGHLFIHPATGLPWFKTDASDTIYGLVPSPSAAMAVPFSSTALAGAQSISFGDDAELFVSDGTKMKVLKSLTPNTWAIDTAHPFHGLPAGSHVAMLRNSDNYDPIEHDGPAWRNLTQAELAPELGPFVGDCEADVNGDDVVDGADVGLLLADWGPGADGLTDINEDGIVDGADLGVLLSQWGACE